MIDGKYFAGRMIKHLNPKVDNLDTKRYQRGQVQRLSENSDEIFRVKFNFSVDNQTLDILVEKIGEDFTDKIKRIKEKGFWKDESLGNLREKRNTYKEHLGHLTIFENGNGDYHITADLQTKNEDKAFYSVLNCIVLPIVHSINS